MPYRQDSCPSEIEGGHMHSNERRVRNTRICHSRDENLALFSDLRTQEHNNFLHPSDVDDAETSLSTEIQKFTSFSNFPSTTPPWKSKSLLGADNEKNDYDWLFTPPATPLFPSLDTKLHPTHVQKSQYNQTPSTSSMSKILRPGARKTCKGNQLAKRSSVPSTDHRNNVTAEITNARPTSHTTIDPSLARPRRASTKCASPSNRSSRGVSLSPTSQALQRHQNGLQVEKPPNLCSTREEWARSHSKRAALHSRRGATIIDSGGLDTGEISRQPKSSSFGSRLPSSVASLEYLSFKEPILDNLLVTLPISAQRDKKPECRRLANGISSQHSSTKGLEYHNSSPKSRVRSTHGKEIKSLSKDMIRHTPSQAPTLLLHHHDRPREMLYTTNPLFKPSTNSIGRSRQEEKLSDEESIDEAGAKESEDKWKQTTFPKTTRKADSNMNQKHVILYNDQTESSVKANSNKKSLQPMPVEGFDELVHKKLANEALLFLERISQDSPKQLQVDTLKPCHFPLKMHDREDEAVGLDEASHEEDEQVSHQKELITESPLKIMEDNPVPTWSLFTNQARKQLQNLHDRLSSCRREAPKVEQQKVEQNQQARHPLEKINAIHVCMVTTQNPIPFDGMKRSTDCRVKKLDSHAVKEKNPIKLLPDAKCQCSIM